MQLCCYKYNIEPKAIRNVQAGKNCSSFVPVQDVAPPISVSTTFTSQGEGHAAGLQLAKYRVRRIAYDVHIRENAGFCARM